MALCAGYEREAWRVEAFANQVFEWLPSFALSWSEQQEALGSESAVQLLRRAARTVYRTDKYERRGEFGELILHGILLQEFGTQAAISKIWFKDAANDTVKGFDVIHVTDLPGDKLHLWLGEAKFYKDLNRGVDDSLSELADHLKVDYLRAEFAFTTNKIDPSAPFAERLRRLLDESTSLDEVFSVLHVPVLLTYDSQALSRHSEHSDEYFEELRVEAEAAWHRFSGGMKDFGQIVVHLVLVPLYTKETLIEILHEKLKSWQNI